MYLKKTTFIWLLSVFLYETVLYMVLKSHFASCCILALKRAWHIVDAQ